MYAQVLHGGPKWHIFRFSKIFKNCFHQLVKAYEECLSISGWRFSSRDFSIFLPAFWKLFGQFLKICRILRNFSQIFVYLNVNMTRLHSDLKILLFNFSLVKNGILVVKNKIYILMLPCVTCIPYLLCFESHNLTGNNLLGSERQ